VVLDRHGCGVSAAPDEIQAQLVAALAKSGWAGRSCAIAIDPELEVWVWSDSPSIARPLGWDSHSGLLSFLRGRGLWPEDAPKPPDPGRALREALRATNTPRSSSLYTDLAARVSFRRCPDPAFMRLLCALREWFPRVPREGA
jgi:hypothetical protein